MKSKIVFLPDYGEAKRKGYDFGSLCMYLSMYVCVCMYLCMYVWWTHPPHSEEEPRLSSGQLTGRDDDIIKVSVYQLSFKSVQLF